MNEQFRMATRVWPRALTCMRVNVPVAAAAAAGGAPASWAGVPCRGAPWGEAPGWRWGSGECAGCLLRLPVSGDDRVCRAVAASPSPAPCPCACGACGPSLWCWCQCCPCRTVTGSMTGQDRNDRTQEDISGMTTHQEWQDTSEITGHGMTGHIMNEWTQKE